MSLLLNDLDILRVKGNHDVDPSCYFYHNWFDRLWCVNIGKIKFIGFDMYNEDSTIPGQATSNLSLHDI